MNLVGVGLPEVLVILAVSFLALGPNRSVDLARTTAKVIREIRRTVNDVTSAVNLDDDPAPSPRRPDPPPPREGPPPTV